MKTRIILFWLIVVPGLIYLIRPLTVSAHEGEKPAFEHPRIAQLQQSSTSPVEYIDESVQPISYQAIDLDSVVNRFYRLFKGNQYTQLSPEVLDSIRCYSEQSGMGFLTGLAIAAAETDCDTTAVNIVTVISADSLSQDTISIACGLYQVRVLHRPDVYAQAKKWGYDSTLDVQTLLSKPFFNIRFANYLYVRDGLRPWQASQTRANGNGWEQLIVRYHRFFAEETV